MKASKNDERLTSFISKSEFDNVLRFLLLEREDLEGELESSVPGAADVEELRTAIALDASSNFGLVANEAGLLRKSAGSLTQEGDA